MSEHNAPLERVSADVAALQGAALELALAQGEALNAIAAHLRGGPSSGSANALLPGRPASAARAAHAALDAAKRALDVATKPMLE